MKKSNWMTTSRKAAGLAIVLMLAGAGAAHAADSDDKQVIDFSSCAKPMYPQADLQAKHEGTVTLGFKPDADGTITDSKVLKSSGYPGLDEAAHSAIAKCRFSPAKDGAKSKDWVQVKYVWTLK